jgi:hypothetical protein
VSTTAARVRKTEHKIQADPLLRPIQYSKCTHRQMTRLWLTKDRPRPLVREGAPQRQNEFQTQTIEKEAISGQTSTKWARHQDILTVSLKVALSLRHDLSSERAPHRDRANSRPKLLKRKQYLVKRPQSGLDTKIYWLTVSLKVTLSQRHDLSSETETERIPDPNSWKGSNIWSNVHKVGSTLRNTDWLTDWLSAVKWLWLCSYIPKRLKPRNLTC